MPTLEQLEARDHPIHAALKEAFDAYVNASDTDRPEARACLLRVLALLAAITGERGEQFMW